jgi:ATP-binding cassette, subfamily C, type I secretion system permease/ATPase
MPSTYRSILNWAAPARPGILVQRAAGAVKHWRGSRAELLAPSQGRTSGETVTLVIQKARGALAGVGVLSGVINLLSLTGSIYMLQVYDRVLPSHSTATLVGLTILMVGFYIAYGLLDLVRLRVMTRLGLRLDRALSKRVLTAVQTLPLRLKRSGDGLQPIRDLDQIRAFLSSPGPLALFDIPWIPVYLALLFLLHPWLGVCATAGAILLVILTIFTEVLSRPPSRAAAAHGIARMSYALANSRNAETIRAMGMADQLGARWRSLNDRHLDQQLRSVDIANGLGSVSKVLRITLQSLLLGIGAYLVIQNEATAGVMIAASIISSRALAPVEVAIAHWRAFLAARQSYARLEMMFAAMPPERRVLNLSRPSKSVSVRDLCVAAPGSQRPILRNISFQLTAGTALGIIGSSASGKSTLAQALVSAWPAIQGSIRLDGASLDQWNEEVLGRDIGYLAQDVQLFDGTVAQNISRFEPDASSEAIIAAAVSAGAHDMIVDLPEGYEMQIGEGGVRLSAGQRQRIALARALYKDPFLVVLDEPNSNLDLEGEAALAQAITSVRSRGGVVIVIAHRPAALATVDQILVLAGGQIKAFGPKDEIMRMTIRPAGENTPTLAMMVATETGHSRHGRPFPQSYRT